MKKIFAIGLSLILPGILLAQLQSYPLVDSLPDNARVYHLPQTGMNIKFSTRIVKEYPGELARYAERFLGPCPIIEEARQYQEIVDVQVETITCSDKGQAYYLVQQQPKKSKWQSKKKSVSANNIKLVCNEQGVIVSLGQEAQSQGFKPVPQPVHQQPQPRNQQHPCITDRLPQGSYMTQEMKMANSSLKMAELAAKQIFSLRETRLALLQGEVEHFPQDGEAFRLYLQELNRMEQQYLELFIGRREESTAEYTLTFFAQKGEQRQLVCRFSSQEGIIDKDDLSGRPIYCLIETESDSLVQTNTSDDTAPCLYYYQPRSSRVSLVDGTQQLWQQTMTLAQMGQLLRLNCEDNRPIILNPETGAIISW